MIRPLQVTGIIARTLTAIYLVTAASVAPLPKN